VASGAGRTSEEADVAALLFSCFFAGAVGIAMVLFAATVYDAQVNKPPPGVPENKPEKPVPAHVLALSEAEKGVLEKLKEFDDQYLASEKEYEVELAALQTKYEKLWFPLLKERAAKLAAGDAKAGCGTPAIKGFWTQALKKSDAFRDLVEEYDEPALDAIKDITYEWLDDKGKTGWKLHFHFAENEFLSNEVVTKTYHTEQANEWDTSLEYTKIELKEPIAWKEGKNLTVELQQKKVKGGGKKKAKAKNKVEEVPRPSFFRHFFKNLGPDAELPTDLEDEEDDDDDDEEFDKMEMYIQDDVEYGEALRDQIIP
jgi:nucleosome assembly protein 1-like 1